MKKAISMILAVLMMLSVLSVAAFAADGIVKNDNVVFVADAGDDAAEGTADKPVKTLQKAFEKLAATGGVAVIEGVVTIDSTNCKMPANDKLITVTSYYDGVDYRSKFYGTDKVTARLNLTNGGSAGFTFGGDVAFDYVIFNVPSVDAKNSIIAAYYNNFEVGANCGTEFLGLDGTAWFTPLDPATENPQRNYYPILISGMNQSSREDHLGGETITEPFTFSIGSGMWQSARIGDRDVPVRNTIDTQVTFNISGGTFVYWTANYYGKDYNLSVQCDYQAILGPNAVVTLNVTGGFFAGEISGFSQVNAISSGDVAHSGKIVMNILGGTFGRVFQDAGNFIVPAMNPNGYKAGLNYGNSSVEVNIDVSKIKLDPQNLLTVVVRENGPAITVNLSEKNDAIVVESGATVNYGSLGGDTPTTDPAPATTDTPTTDPTPATTPAPATEPTPATTAAGGDVTPPTGDNMILVAIAAAAVLCTAAVVLLKKRED